LISLSSLSFGLIGAVVSTFSFVLAYSVLQAFPSKVTGNNTGLAGWAYWALFLVSLSYTISVL